MRGDVSRYRRSEQALWESVGAVPTERRLRLARTGVSVRVQELGEGPTVIFVHGTTSAGSSWAPLAARLGDIRCVLLDRPGCGLSDPLPRPFDVEALASLGDSMLVELLDALGSESASIVATSFGGYFTFRAAAADPPRFDRIVEMGYTIGAPILHVPLMMRAAGVPLLGRLAARMPITERSVRMILRQAGLGGALDSGRFDQPSIDWFLSLLRDTSTMRNEFQLAPRVVLPLSGLNEEILFPAGLLSSIRAPVRFFWGEDDPFGGGDTARALAALLSDAHLELVPGAGHAPWIDEPERAAASVREHLLG